MPVVPLGPTCAMLPPSFAALEAPEFGDELPPELQAALGLPLRQNRDKFKTEMCRNWMSVGVCRYGDKW